MANDYHRKKATLQAIQEEFRRLSFTHPPLFHERFLFPQGVSPDGWQAFIAAHSDKNTWEKWHLSWSKDWVGRFYGSPAGFHEFTRLCDAALTVFGHVEVSQLLGARVPEQSLSTLSHVLTSPQDIWCEVLHLMAHACSSPLLHEERRVFGLEPEELLDEAGRPNESPLHAQEGTPPCTYPQHPLQRTLAFNVFSSSVEAMRIIIDPESVVLSEGVQYDDLPLVLVDEESERAAANVAVATGEQNVMLTDEDSLPRFLFRKVGNGWIVRFWTGKTQEYAPLPNMKGCQHYQRLLMTPYKEIACLDLDPRGAGKTAGGGSVVTENERQHESGFEKDDYDATVQRYLHDDVSRGMIQEVLRLEEQINGETDETNKERLKQVRSQAEASLRDYIGKAQGDAESVRAYNRVKKALRDARQFMKSGGGLDRFVEHLEKSVQPMIQVWKDHGFRYAPENEPNWVF